MTMPHIPQAAGLPSLLSWAILVMALLPGTSCSREDSDWEIDEVALALGPYHRIEVRNVFDIELVQDGRWGVEVEGGSQALQYLNIRVEDSTLILDRRRKGDYRHPRVPTPVATVHFDTLNRITTRESCSIHSATAITGRELGIVDDSKFIEVDLELDMGIFYFWNTPNPSQLALHGRTDQLKLWIAGLGAADAQSLVSQYVLLESHTQGECKALATDKLEYSITSTGNILYFGTPATLIPLEHSGSGKLIPGN